MRSTILTERWTTIVLPTRLQILISTICFSILISNTTPVEAKAASANPMTKASWHTDNGKQCNIYENETLHALMDRVCELCHEMFSHQNPSMRAKCRADCFRSDQFRKCLLIFRPSRTSRHNRTRQLLF